MKVKQQLTSVRLAVILAVTAFTTAGCGALSTQAVNDNIKYQGSKRVKMLAIPPSLSTPKFTKTYASTPDTVAVKEDTTKKGERILVLAEPDIRIWQRLETTLPAMGLPILSKNSDRGIYTVSYAITEEKGDPVSKNGEGRLMRWLGLNKDKTKRKTIKTQEEYLVLVGRSSGQAAVAVRPGKKGNVKTAQSILNRLKVELGG